MARTVSIGKQWFEDLRAHNCFYVDKTSFIGNWWRAQDDITLICRPRRFGKTLTLDMVRCFLSMKYAGRGEELFGGLAVWDDAPMRALQGTMPIVYLSFADCKADTLDEIIMLARFKLSAAVREYSYLLESPRVSQADRAFLALASRDDMDDTTARTSLQRLCRALYAHHGIKPVVLLDEYDTTMQEAWLGGFWDGMASFVRGLFNATFKTNPDLGRALLTGITRVASESVFSDLNNPNVVTVTTPQYETAFGFTEDEVGAALDEFGMADRLPLVKEWYDGYSFGDVPGMYNPWSITHLLDRGRIDLYWTNSSSNALVSNLVRSSSPALKEDFEALLDDRTVCKSLTEEVDFRSLEVSPSAIWSLLLATGYLRVDSMEGDVPPRTLGLRLTNQEVRLMFDGLVRKWFANRDDSWSEFCRSLAAGDRRGMTRYLSDLAPDVMSSFDSGTKPSKDSQPERFWHGMVLGLLVEMRGTHRLTSNRESGYGRYDVALVPRDPSAQGPTGEAHVIEFKVVDSCDGEKTLQDAVSSAHAQIQAKAYDAGLIEAGVDPTRIHHWGIAFQGKDVLVG